MYVCFLVWAFLPANVLRWLGVTYYPSRYYAVALPAYIIVLYTLSGVMYMGYNLTNTLAPDDRETIRDRVANRTRQAPLSVVKCGLKEGIPDFGDIDVLELSTVLR